MNDDYLWDKSGEPDPQVKELEEILAPLRYKPTPLEIPEKFPVERKRNYVPLLAIAATVLIALIAGAVWLRLRTEKSTPPQEQAKAIPSAPSAPPVQSVVQEVTPTPEVVKNTPLPKKPIRRYKPALTKQDREEALVAKEQVMLALRLASEKIKLAQRRTLTPSPNQIKNQHKVG